MEAYVVGDYVVEDSKSRRGRHRAMSTILIYSREHGVLTLSKASDKVVEVREAKPTYSRGYAKAYKLRLEKGEYAVYGWFVKNFLGRVKGFVEVYSYKGELLYRAKYVDGVVRRSIGNPVNAWLVRVFVEAMKIPVRKSRLGDEAGSK